MTEAGAAPAASRRAQARMKSTLTSTPPRSKMTVGRETVLSAVMLFRASAEVRRTHFGVLGEFPGRARGHHPALRQHVAVLRDGQGLVHVLLHQQHGDAE